MNFVKSIEKTRAVLAEVLCERINQDQRWGEQNWDNGCCQDEDQWNLDNIRGYLASAYKEEHTSNWKDILREEFLEVTIEVDDKKIREELIQLAAVAVNWVEAIDRRKNS